MSNENPPASPSEPTLAPTPIPVPVQQVGCPNCLTLVPAGTPICPKCGYSIPPIGPLIPAPSAPHKSRLPLIIGIILVILLVGGVAGYMFYNNQQQQVLQAAKNTEQAAANQAPDQMQFTCLAVTTDMSHLTVDPYYHTASGYMLVNEKFGLRNPTRFPIDAKWAMTIDYTSVNLILSTTTPFHLPANGVAYPVLAFQITAAQLTSLTSNPDLSKFTVTLDGTYAVTGTYSTYNLSQHATYDSATATGTGTLAASANPPAC